MRLARHAAASLCAFSLCLGALIAPTAHAQVYPAKGLRIIVPTPPGGPGDVVARGLAQALSPALGQPVIVENRVGGDGMIAGEACVRAAPDGYTICVIDGYTMVLNPAVRAKMPYDASRDLTPIVHLGALPAGILVNSSVKANSLRELFELAKASPGKVTWGSFGLASSSYLYIEWLKNARDISFYNVPYKAAIQAFQALLSGEVEVVVFATGPALPHIKTGRIKAIAVNTASRLGYLPDVPTIAESGLEISVVTWFGLYAPAGLPKAIVQRLNAETTARYLNDPTYRDKFLKPTGIELQRPAGESPEAFAEFMKAEGEMYTDLVKVAKIRIE